MVDRDREAGALRRAAASPPSLVVLIGRRRVGKSFLLARSLEGERVVSFQGDEQSEAQHLALLAEEAGRTLIGSTGLVFGTWDAALRFLGEQARHEPLALVLDEFQWMKFAQPALDSILARHWDVWERDRVPITLVLSGSALTLMERLLEPGAPLHGRATTRLRLQPLDYRDAAQFAPGREPVELLRRWAVLGGTPQYNVWGGPGPIEEIIREHVLAKDAPLYDDPRHLLREGEGIRDPGTYLAILQAVARGATAHNEIAQQARVPTGNLSRKLERLEDLGYVSPRSALARDGSAERSIYEIADPYFRFWFRYVLRNRSRLESGRIEEVYAEIAGDFENIMGAAFEQCCRAWIERHASEELTGAPQQVGSWWSRRGDVEIDIVGTRQHRYVLVGAVKWRRIVDTDVLEQLIEQQAALGSPARSATLLVLAREGFTAQMTRQAAEEGVRLLSAKDLFA
jgi:AAA+ ATPase superfamily predicted ATPase